MDLFVPLDKDLLSPWQPGLTGMVFYIVMVFGLLAVLLVLTRLLGTGRRSTEKLRSYESGIIPTGAARIPYPAPFYLIAVFFLVFDIEVAFILAWAIAFRQLGWAGWLRICGFIIVLLAGLYYIWKKGGLAWGRQ